MSTATGKIIGKAGMGHVNEEAQTVLASSMKPVYESHEFSLPNGANGYDFKAQQNAFRATMPRAHAVLIRTSQNVKVRFNDNANDSITIFADTPFPYSALEMTNIFFDNASGFASDVLIVLG